MRLVPTHTLVENAVPLVSLGSGEARLADEMARFVAPGAGSTSDLLRELRAAFPDSPLAVRVRALAALQRR
jgi:hypothetical protein